MTLTGLFNGIGDFLVWTFNLLEADAIGNKMNYAIIILGFIGLFFWLNKQRKFNQAAENDPNQLK